MKQVRDLESLRALYPKPQDRAVRKDIGHLDAMCRRLIGASPMVVLASFGAGGNVDATPRGGPPGFVSVLDDQHLAVPDATGNRRLDSLANIVETGRVGLLFLIPGRDTTLRVNGSAVVTDDVDLLASITPVGKPPLTAVVVETAEVYAHCPKAFIRSGLWDPESWLDPAALPTSAEVTHAHLSIAALDLSLDEIRRGEQESVRERLA